MVDKINTFSLVALTGKDIFDDLNILQNIANTRKSTILGENSQKFFTPSQISVISLVAARLLENTRYGLITEKVSTEIKNAKIDEKKQLIEKAYDESFQKAGEIDHETPFVALYIAFASTGMCEIRTIQPVIPEITSILDQNKLWGRSGAEKEGDVNPIGISQCIYDIQEGFIQSELKLVNLFNSDVEIRDIASKKENPFGNKERITRIYLTNKIL